MKKILFTLLAMTLTVLAVNAAPHSFADDDRMFVQVSGGLSMADGTEMFSQSRYGSNDWDIGYNTFASVGQYLLAGAYVSLEYSHIKMGVDQSKLISNEDGIDVVSETTSGHLMANSLMVNLVYETALNDHIFWYLGGGIGFSWVHANHGLNDAVMAWQAMVGLGFALNEHVAIVGGYRLFTTHDLEDTSDGGRKFEYDTPYIHNFEVGVRYSF